MASSWALGAVVSSSKSILGHELFSPMNSPKMLRTKSSKSARCTADDDDFFSPMNSPTMAKAVSVKSRNRDAFFFDPCTSPTAHFSAFSGSSEIPMGRKMSRPSNTEERTDEFPRFSEELELPMGARKSMKAFVEMSSNLAQASQGEAAEVQMSTTRSSRRARIMESLQQGNEETASQASQAIESSPVEADLVGQTPPPEIIEAPALSPFENHAANVKSFPVLLGRLGSRVAVRDLTTEGISRTLLEQRGRLSVAPAPRQGRDHYIEGPSQNCGAQFLAQQARQAALAMRLRRQSRDSTFVI